MRSVVEVEEDPQQTAGSPRLGKSPPCPRAMMRGLLAACWGLLTSGDLERQDGHLGLQGRLTEDTEVRSWDLNSFPENPIGKVA